MSKISIVGLGPGEYSLISQGALDALHSSCRIYLRTEKHPIVNKLKETIKSNLDKIMDDLKLIATQEHKDEILYEYKRSLNVSVAITSVTERYKAIEEEKARAEAERAEREKAEQAVSTTLDEYEPFVANVPEEVAPPVEEISEQPQQDEKVLSLSFKVYGTNHSLKILHSLLSS